MNIGDRIKLRRKDLGLSAEEIAAKLGVSPATVYRYESNAIANMRIDKLEPIANVLHTTPAYLMGWEEPISSSPVQNLDPYKSQLIDCYDRLNDSGKKEACRRVSELTEIPRYITSQSEESTGKLAIVAMGGDGVKFIKTTKEADEEVKRILKEMWEEEENKK